MTYSEMTYDFQCKSGRDHARVLMGEVAKTGDLPKLVRAIREAVKDEGGFGVGFLFQVAGLAK